MNELTTQPRKMQNTGNALDSLPQWLKMLAGNYSDSWANEMTFAVLHSQFSHVPPDMMNTAVKRYMSREKKFPNVASLKPYVDEELRTRPLLAVFQSMQRLGYTYQKEQSDETRSVFTKPDGQQAVINH